MSGPVHPFALLADIGGTNARFAVADTRRSSPLLLDSVRQFEVAHFSSLVHAAQHYVADMPGIAADLGAGVFAVAGRIDGDEARITNHPWLISRRATQAALQLPSLRLVNDFAAQAMALVLLEDQDLVAVGNVARLPADKPDRTYAVLGPGTGLGVSALIVRDGVAHALETEGGHISFAAGCSDEAAVLDLLRADFGRVSNERLVSGGGLVNIHRALARRAGVQLAGTRRPQEITAGAASGDPLCAAAVQMFCSVFGAIAGDLVLAFGAWDGVFLTGGLVPRLLPDLQAAQFRERFEAKGRFSDALARVPTLAVMHPQAGLLGAAAFAMQPLAAARSAA